RSLASANLMMGVAGSLALAARMDLAMRAAPARREAFGLELLRRAIPLLPLGVLLLATFLFQPRRSGPGQAIRGAGGAGGAGAGRHPARTAPPDHPPARARRSTHPEMVTDIEPF
ncbi:MAG TPA: hypothetical protein VN914_04845, partial [Polyangia bacterium]|nr:hypothetical protein [Polyangia bacterium]